MSHTHDNTEPTTSTHNNSGTQNGEVDALAFSTTRNLSLMRPMLATYQGQREAMSSLREGDLLECTITGVPKHERWGVCIGEIDGIIYAVHNFTETGLSAFEELSTAAGGTTNVKLRNEHSSQSGSKWVRAEELAKVLQIGDVVEFRRNGKHNHWGVCTGFGFDGPVIIHKTEQLAQTELLCSTSVSATTQGLPEIRQEPLYQVAGDGLCRIDVLIAEVTRPISIIQRISKTTKWIFGPLVTVVSLITVGAVALPVLFLQAINTHAGQTMSSRAQGEWQTPRELERELMIGDIVQLSTAKVTRYNCNSLFGVYVGVVDDCHMVVRVLKTGSAVSFSGITETVIMEELTTAVGEDKCRVSNIFDDRYSPLQAELIVERAKAKIGKSNKTTNFGLLTRLFCPRYFAAFCRYGDQSEERAKRSAWKTAAELSDDVEVGDMIEFQSNFAYAHWGICTGNFHGIPIIVHKTQTGQEKPATEAVASNISPQCNSVMSATTGTETRILLEPLIAAAGGCKCRINNLLDLQKRPLPIEHMVKNAERYFEEMNQTNDYNLVNKNCEHFASLCRYGEGSSSQIQIILYVGVLTTICILGTIFLNGASWLFFIIGMLAARYMRGLHHFFWRFDIRLRRFLMKSFWSDDEDDTVHARPIAEQSSESTT